MKFSKYVLISCVSTSISFSMDTDAASVEESKDTGSLPYKNVCNPTQLNEESGSAEGSHAKGSNYIGSLPYKNVGNPTQSIDKSSSAEKKQHIDMSPDSIFSNFSNFSNKFSLTAPGHISILGVDIDLTNILLGEGIEEKISRIGINCKKPLTKYLNSDSSKFTYLKEYYGSQSIAFKYKNLDLSVYPSTVYSQYHKIFDAGKVFMTIDMRPKVSPEHLTYLESQGIGINSLRANTSWHSIMLDFNIKSFNDDSMRSIMQHLIDHFFEPEVTEKAFELGLFQQPLVRNQPQYDEVD